MVLKVVWHSVLSRFGCFIIDLHSRSEKLTKNVFTDLFFCFCTFTDRSPTVWKMCLIPNLSVIGETMSYNQTKPLSDYIRRKWTLLLVIIWNHGKKLQRFVWSKPPQYVWQLQYMVINHDLWTKVIIKDYYYIRNKIR